MNKNMLFDNVFTDAQVEKIKKMIESNYHRMSLNDDPNRGRDDLPIGTDIDQEIKDVVLGLVKDHELWHVTYSEYNNKHLNPNLPKHKDPNYEDGSLTFDYQLEANVDWPICIEDDCYTLQNNQALTFDPKNQWHYRPDMAFSDGEYVRIVFFYLKAKTQ